MAYIVKQDLVDAIGADLLMKLTDDAGTGEVNDDVVGRAIAFAESTFESYARTRYSLPVAATTKVRSTCGELATYWLEKKRAKTIEAVKMLQEKYKPTFDYLKDVSTGKAALDVPAAEETSENPASADRILSGPSKPATFSDDKLCGF